MSCESILCRIDSIPYSPVITPERFCELQPCVEVSFGHAQFTLIQPTSTAIVYFLGLLWIAASAYFAKTRGAEKSRAWWSSALLLGGIAALSAGTSYQAFGYQIKCAGRDACVWTSWWEVIYQTLQVASMDAMLIAVAYSSASGKLRIWLVRYSVLNALTHVVITSIGVYLPSKFLISFELLVLFSVPNLALVFALCLSRYKKLKEKLDLTILCACGWLVFTTAAYFAYMTSGLTQKLWDRGIWFSDNDVLHILMIAWIIYVPLVPGKLVKDAR